VQFENALTERYCAPGEAITLAANATAGIAAALIALGVKGNVLIPAFTFPATLSAVVMAGARPWVLDVDTETWGISADALEQALRTGNYEAALVVVPFGVRIDLRRHFEACTRYGAALVVDNAPGLGAAAAPLPAGRFMEVYSLHATKPFAIGEGGAIRAHRGESELLRRALNFGLLRGAPPNGTWGINGKMPEISAAVGLAVLEDFGAMLAARRRAVSRYIAAMRAHSGLAYVDELDRSPWQTFPVLLPSAEMLDEFIARAAAAGLEIRNCHRPTLEDWPGATKTGPCPVSSSLSQRMACIPVYSDITEREISTIIGIVDASLAGISLHPA
jgi:dTDP-4-amino-4,6-dideoxygalactose transaminase